jgi:hypothetical protein
MRGNALVAIVATFAIGVAGCGGHQADTLKSGTVSAGAVDSDFTKQVEAICERTQTRVVALMRRGGEDPNQLTSARTQALTAYRQQITALEALDPPSAVASVYHQYIRTLVALEKGLAVRLKEAAELEKQEVHDPTSKDHALAEREQGLQRKATSLANGVGLHACN